MFQDVSGDYFIKLLEYSQSGCRFGEGKPVATEQSAQTALAPLRASHFGLVMRTLFFGNGLARKTFDTRQPFAAAPRHQC
jgi:hypothetical protein